MADITREQIQILTIQQMDDLTAMIADVRKEMAVKLHEDAKSRILTIAKDMGTTIEALFGYGRGGETKRAYTKKGEGGTKMPSTPVAPKFKHPENDTITYSGRGRKPQWFLDYIANGGNENDILISKK